MQEEKPVALEIDVSSMPVDDSYDGPMMEGKTCSHCGKHVTGNELLRLDSAHQMGYGQLEFIS